LKRTLGSTAAAAQLEADFIIFSIIQTENTTKAGTMKQPTLIILYICIIIHAKPRQLCYVFTAISFLFDGISAE
jgi:hypothetical protein